MKDQEQKKALIDFPMSAYRFMQNNKGKNTPELMENYANYLSQYHVEKASDLIAERAKYKHTCNDGKGCGIPYCDALCGCIDKQSILSTAKEYVELNIKR